MKPTALDVLLALHAHVDLKPHACLIIDEPFITNNDFIVFVPMLQRSAVRMKLKLNALRPKLRPIMFPFRPIPIQKASAWIFIRHSKRRHNVRAINGLHASAHKTLHTCTCLWNSNILSNIKLCSVLCCVHICTTIYTHNKLRSISALCVCKWHILYSSCVCGRRVIFVLLVQFAICKNARACLFCSRLPHFLLWCASGGVTTSYRIVSFVIIIITSDK